MTPTTRKVARLVNRRPLCFIGYMEKADRHWIPSYRGRNADTKEITEKSGPEFTNTKAAEE